MKYIQSLIHTFTRGTTLLFFLLSGISKNFLLGEGKGIRACRDDENALKQVKYGCPGQQNPKQ